MSLPQSLPQCARRNLRVIRMQIICLHPSACRYSIEFAYGDRRNLVPVPSDLRWQVVRFSVGCFERFARLEEGMVTFHGDIRSAIT